MIVKKLRYFALALVVVAFCACQKEPSTSGLHRDYLVYTGHDTDINFDDFETYYLPDSILLIGGHEKTSYWKNSNALEIINSVATNLDAAGFTRIAEKDAADLGIQLSYVERETYFIGYDAPYWWQNYPYYWAPGYWGDWYGWHYPYGVYYGYTSGSLLIEMLNLGAETDRKLPIIWDSFISGLLTSSVDINQQRALDAVEQAFDQSSYLKNN